MDYTDASFTGLMFNVNRLPEGVDILAYFPKLAEYSEFRQPLPDNLDRNKVISYIVYFWDRKTPLHRIDNVLARKNEAAMLAKFPRKKDEYTPAYQEVILNTHEVINKMIMRYIRMQKNAKFAKFIIYDEALYLQMEKLRIEKKGKDEEKINDILKAIDQISRVHEQLQGDLLGGDQTQGLIEELYSQVEYEQLSLRPEDIALKIEVGKDPLDGFKEFEDEV